MQLSAEGRMVQTCRCGSPQRRLMSMLMKTGLETKYGMEFDFPDENTALTEDPRRETIYSTSTPNERQTFSLFLVRSRETGKVVRQIEPILRALD